MSSLKAPWQNGPYIEKHTIQNHEEHREATDVFRIFLFSFISYL